MATVDEKVVRLTMDDSQFDKASDKTIKKLDDLKKSLEFSGAVSSFNELDKAAAKVDMSPLEKGAQTVARQFSALEAIALGALMRIGSQAVATGERLIKSLTIDNISTGWSKYGEKTKAVQTIMSATAKQFTDTGEQMEFVEEKLERLNWFTDETSYKFLDMVNNIGKFTNNNVELGKAVTAMEGISTWAASAGANTNEAGRAMYNLSQAIAVGSVKLIDWKSIENANMATAEFKQIAIETAEELGTLKRVGADTWETLSGKGVSVANFNENLSEAWFSSEVLLQTLDRYGGFADRLADVVDETGIMTTSLLGYVDDYIDGTLDISAAVEETQLSAEELNSILAELGDEQYELGRRAFKAAQETKTFSEAIEYVQEAVGSGWMQSFELIFGNYTEAKEMWSELSEALYEVFVESGNVRNELLRLWKSNGGRDRFIESVKTALSNIMKLVDAVSEGFKRIFPDATLENLLVATRRFELLVEKLTPSEKLLQNISNVVEFLVNAISKAIALAGAVVSGLDPILNLLVDIFSVIMNIAGFASGEGNDVLNNMFNHENLQRIHDTIYGISEVLATIAKILITIGAGAFAGILQFANNVWQTFREGEGGIQGFFQAIVVNVQSAISVFTNGEGIIGKIVGGIVEKVKELINSFKEAASGGAKEGIGGFLGGIVKSIENSGVFDMLGALINMINEALVSIANGVAGILTGGTELRDVINFVQKQLAFLWDWLKASISSMTFQDLAVVALLISLKSLTDTAKKLVNSLSGTISGISSTLTALKTTIASFANGNWLTDLGTSLTNIAKNTKFAQIALAIYIAVEGIIKLSEIDVGKLGYAVSALAVILGLVTLAVGGLNKLAGALASGSANRSKNLARVASSIQALGIAVGLISASVYALSLTVGEDNDYGKLFASLMSVMGILTALTLVIAAFDKFNIDTSKFGKIGPALLTFAVTIDLISLAVVALAQFDPYAVQSAAMSIAVIIGSLGLMGKLIAGTDWATMLAASATMITMSGAIAVLAVAIGAFMAAFAAFPDSMAEGIIAIVGSITLLMLAIGLLGGASQTANPLALLAMAAAMITFSTSIVILAGAAAMLAAVPWEAIGKAGVIAAGAILSFLAVVGIAYALAPGVLVLSGLLVALATAMIGLGVGVSMISDAAIKIGVFVTALALAGDQLGDEFPAKLSKAFELLETMVRGFLAMIRNLAPDFALTFGMLIVAAIEAVIYAVNAKEYAMLEAVMTVILAVLELLARLGGPIINALTRTVEGMTAEMPRLMTAIGEFIEELFAGIGTLLNHAGKGLIRGFFNIFGLDWEAEQNKMSEAMLGNLEESLNEAGYILDKGTGKILEEVNGTLVEVDVQYNQATKTWEKTLSEGMSNAATNSVNDFNSTFDEKMDETKTNTENFGKEVGDSAIEGYREATGWGSPWETILKSIEDMKESFGIGLGGISSSVNTMFYDFGGGAVASMYEGMNDNDPLDILSTAMGYAAGSNVKLVNDNPEGIQSTRNIGMNPGSQAAAREVRAALEQEAISAGAEDADAYTKSLVDGLVGNIGSGSSSAASAAKEEIKEESEIIAEAYEEAIEEIEMRANQTDLEHNLWSSINRDAEEAELVAKNIAYTAKKISYQQERLDAAMIKYKDLIAAYGEDSVEARKAYMEVLEAQTDLVDLQNDMVDLQNTYISNEEELTKRMQTVRNNRQLEYDLWVSQNANASDAEKAMMEKQYLQDQLVDATDDLILAQDNYTRAVERYGENSNEAMEAWGAYLKAMIAQSDLQNKLTESQTTSAQDMEEAWRNYARYFNENKEVVESLQNLGFSAEEIASYVRDVVGIPELIQEAAKETEETAARTAEEVYTKYGMTLQAGFAEFEPALVNQGGVYTEKVKEGMTSEKSLNSMKNAVEIVMTTGTNTAGSSEIVEKWNNVGENTILGLIQGLNNKEGALYERIEEIIQQALAVANRAAGIHSPSKVTEWMGEMLDLGWAKGLDNYRDIPVSAAAEIVNRTLDEFRGTSNTSNLLSFAGGQIAEGLAKGFDDYSYTMLEASQGLIDRLNEQWEEENQINNTPILDMLRVRGYDIEDIDYELVLTLNTEKAYEDMSDFEKQLMLWMDPRPTGRIGTKWRVEDFQEQLGIEDFEEASERFNAINELARQIWHDIGISAQDAMKAWDLFEQRVGNEGRNTADARERDKINYTQNIYSNKPLSPLDVYRNTNKALEQIT